ncbi:DUF2178 domain-containing protein [Patescibacteria group bacterium]|nr:DUF2178 domain-containing protein [Patescibacteria group bacterium]
MDIKKYKQIRFIAILFIISIITISVFLKLYLLTLVSIFTGIILFSLVHLSNKNIIDERELSIQEKAADFTYSIFGPTIGIGAFILLIPSFSNLSVFSKGEFLFLESLGTIFAFLTLFLITLYSISYFFLAKKFGGKKDEE